MSPTINVSINLPAEALTIPLLAITDHLIGGEAPSDSETAHERIAELTQENETLTAQIAKLTERIAELEAENTPPEGCDASWKRANVWVSPPYERGFHEVRWADGTISSEGRYYVKDDLGVTFP